MTALQKALRTFSRKWAADVLVILTGGPLRFSEISRQLPGCSVKVLSEVLNDLTEHGLVEKTIYPEIPPRTEYRLTPMGEKLVNPLLQIVQLFTEQ